MTEGSPPTTCHMSHVTCHVSCVMCHISCVKCHVSCVACHVSHVTCHVSHVMCHMSCVKILVFVFNKVAKLIGGGSVINGSYPGYFLPYYIKYYWGENRYIKLFFEKFGTYKKEYTIKSLCIYYVLSFHSADLL